jgi:hypothetical protein
MAVPGQPNNGLQLTSAAHLLDVRFREALAAEA